MFDYLCKQVSTCKRSCRSLIHRAGNADTSMSQDGYLSALNGRKR